MGRTQKIIPFIIDGTAHASFSEDECGYVFPFIELQVTTMADSVMRDEWKGGRLAIILYLETGFPLSESDQGKKSGQVDVKDLEVRGSLTLSK